MKSALQYLLQAALCMINTHLLVLTNPTSNTRDKKESYKYQLIYTKIKEIYSELEEEN